MDIYEANPFLSLGLYRIPHINKRMFLCQKIFSTDFVLVSCSFSTECVLLRNGDRTVLLGAFLRDTMHRTYCSESNSIRLWRYTLNTFSRGKFILSFSYYSRYFALLDYVTITIYPKQHKRHTRCPLLNLVVVTMWCEYHVDLFCKNHQER